LRRQKKITRHIPFSERSNLTLDVFELILNSTFRT